MKNITIRPLKLADYSGVRKINEVTQCQYLGEKWNSFTQAEKDQHLVSRKKEFGINVRTGYSLVATIDNEIVGFLFAHETLPFHGILYVRHIAIKPDWQGKGVGVLLYKKLIDLAKLKKIKRITAYINMDNPKSLKLHEKLGFSLKDRIEAKLGIFPDR